MSSNKEYDLICSLGGNCAAAHNLRIRNLRTVAYPFDWTYFKSDSAVYKLADNFVDGFKNFLKTFSYFLFSKTSSIALRKVALSAAPTMTCGWPLVGMNTMVGRDWMPMAMESSFSLSVSTL